MNKKNLIKKIKKIFTKKFSKIFHKIIFQKKFKKIFHKKYDPSKKINFMKIISLKIFYCVFVLFVFLCVVKINEKIRPFIKNKIRENFNPDYHK